MDLVTTSPVPGGRDLRMYLCRRQRGAWRLRGPELSSLPLFRCRTCPLKYLERTPGLRAASTAVCCVSVLPCCVCCVLSCVRHTRLAHSASARACVSMAFAQAGARLAHSSLRTCAVCAVRVGRIKHARVSGWRVTRTTQARTGSR
jgi:hypothetical protein